MVFVYIVRCNFTAPEQEAAWNAWYSGPKIAQMLANPHFLSCQRFRRISGTGRNYLALWTVATPEALTTPQYTSQWGFADWSSCITDWSRDLFDGGNRAATDFAVDEGGALHVIGFDAMAPHDAEAAHQALAASRPDLIWIPVIGLDRHTPWIGLRPLAGMPSAPAATPPVGDAIYRPISAFHATGATPA